MHIVHIVHICLLYCSFENETIVCAVQYSTVCNMQYVYFNVHIVHIVYMCICCAYYLSYCSVEDETIGEITTVCVVQCAYFDVHIVHIMYIVHFTSRIALLKMKQLVRLQLSAAAGQEMGEGNTAIA